MSSFWESEISHKYEDFATTIPSDIPAYKVVHHLLEPGDKKILDFGCFRGVSSANILANGAKYVLGVDREENNIATARAGFRVANLDFDHVLPENPILTMDYFDAASMTFVHPTIENADELAFQIKKISDVVRSKGILVMLGLNPQSFGNHDFLFYKHEVPERLKDGEPFRNTLKLPNGEQISFTDYYWSMETLWQMLFEAGFTTQTYINLSEKVRGDIRRVFDQSLSELDCDWEDEWKAPLYSIIVAQKG